MLKVLVFEDHADEVQILSEYAKHFFETRHISYDLDFRSAFPDDLDLISGYDIIFLDIELGEQNGISFGKKLTEQYPEMVTIITSQYSQYLIEGYKINARRYFLKPYSQDFFNAEMDDVLSSTYFKQHYGFYDDHIAPFKIHYRDILYVEYALHKSVIHLSGSKVISCRYPLKYWHDKLSGKGFSQPYKSFIVNLAHIDDLTENKKEIIMGSGDAIPLSKHYKKQFLFDYTEYLHTAI